MEKYQSFEFTGYVYKKKKSKWGMELYLKSNKEDSAEKYPQQLKNVYAGFLFWNIICIMTIVVLQSRQ